jgi:quercetin dioxygenase-like cupin family protein
LAGNDLEGEIRGLGISTTSFKILPAQNGDVLVLENTFHARGGPPRHAHHAQDEWFYALAGEFIVEIGAERVRMHPGDSLLAPRQVPHAWAFIGNGLGRMLIAFLPAGQMESFFQEVSRANAMPTLDPAVWQAHGMTLLGPPLEVDPTP